MFTLKTGEAKQYIEDGKTLLGVPFTIENEAGEVVQAMTQSFPIETSADEVRETLQRHLTVFTEDGARYEEGKAAQEAFDGSQEVVQEISNITL